MKFEDVTVGQEVNVKLNSSEDEVETGIVRYKGPLVSLKGVWVGVELTSKLGTSNGLYKGIQYFSCREGHGMYIRASALSLFTRKRKLFAVYHKIGPSSVQDNLFRPSKKEPVCTDPKNYCTISQSYLLKAKTSFASPNYQTSNPSSLFSYDGKKKY
ncbi:CAP-Gly domain-containing linker protein 4-like isoform X1 [Oopsacas minuta]|uniref:CAP-Gly domain-containing linker protein 4-like isoform X1 n=1 Tax=Oopsacas minuta TaxID=111878 RepID=A0AAV7JJ91_9METZ|nr:CAP-Gly domain-containing linker protein 4-like isoform X1 [Oopsacas minuta]